MIDSIRLAVGTSDSHDLRLWNVACVPRSIWGMVSAQSAAVHMMPCSRCAALLPLLLLALLLLPEPVACAASASDSADTAPGFDLWAPTYDEDAVELGWAAPEQAAAQLSPFLPDLQALRGDGQLLSPYTHSLVGLLRFLRLLRLLGAGVYVVWLVSGSLGRTTSC